MRRHSQGEWHFAIQLVAVLLGSHHPASQVRSDKGLDRVQPASQGSRLVSRHNLVLLQMPQLSLQFGTACFAPGPWQVQITQEQMQRCTQPCSLDRYLADLSQD